MAVTANKTFRTSGTQIRLIIRFDDNNLLAQLVGDRDRNLLHLEQKTHVRLSCRGNRIAVIGNAPSATLVRDILLMLHHKLRSNIALNSDEIDATIRMIHSDHPTASTSLSEQDLASDREEIITSGKNKNGACTIKTRRGVITPRTPNQLQYLSMMDSYNMVFGLGPAGTGKTYLAVAKAVEMLLAGEVDRIILSRPAVEAGERLGFLPGDMKDKIDPYLRPLYDALYDMMPADQIARKLTNGEIEIAPLAFMRGRTLAHAFIILDEAQNATTMQMKMFLTRMGAGSRMVITGDLSQVDLPRGTLSGLENAVDVLRSIKDIAFIRFSSSDVVRHSLVSHIIEAYDSYQSNNVKKHKL